MAKRYLDEVSPYTYNGRQLQEIVVTPYSVGNSIPENHKEEVEAERARQRNIAKQYFSQAPLLGNIINGTKALVNSLPIVGVDENDVMGKYRPMTGIAPIPTKVTSIKRGVYEVFSTNGKSYVNLGNGKVMSLDKFKKLEDIELINAFKHDDAREAERLASKIKGKYIPKNTDWHLNPTTNIRATSGSINRINGKYSNRNANNANMLFDEPIYRLNK